MKKFFAVVVAAFAVTLSGYAGRIDDLRTAAERGDADAQFALADHYYRGKGVPKDRTEGLKWYRKAAEQGHASAQCKLGQTYFYFVEGRQAEGLKWYRKAAEQGYADAQYRLGLIYGGSSKGVPKDDTESVKWYRKAAEQGHAEAQSLLAHNYFFGRGVPIDYAEAARWYRKDAERGEAYAQYRLGFCYVFGRAGTKVEGAKWLKKAAEQGYSDAQYRLGECYLNGWGVPEDRAEAVKWYREAARNLNREAMLALDKLGELYTFRIDGKLYIGKDGKIYESDIKKYRR